MKGKPFVPTTTKDPVFAGVQRDIKDTFDQLDQLRRGLLAFLPVVQAGDYTIGEETFVVYTGPGGHTFTLPKGDALTGKARVIFVMNNGAGILTIRRSGTDTVNSGQTDALGAGAGTAIAGDGGTAWHVLGTADPLRVANLIVSVSATLASLTVTGQANMRGLVVFPGSAIGPVATAALVGDYRQVEFGTVNKVILGNLVSGAGFSLGSGPTEKIGKWGVTPVVQPVLATGAGHTVDDVIAMLQSNGDCRQV